MVNKKLLDNFDIKSVPGVLIVIALTVGSFVMGSMYTKIQYLEGKIGTPAPSVQAVAGNNQPTAPARPQAPTKVNPKVTADDPYLGNPTAKLVVVEFGDYQCPFCGKFFKDIEPQLKTDYLDTGKIKFVFKNLAFLGKESLDAANAAMCAKEQDKFWQYHDYLYGNQAGENQGAFSSDNLKKIAVTLSLNSTQFNSCLDSQKYNAQVQADNAEASRISFTSTPSTAVGDTPVIGAQSYAAFKTIIDQKLSQP